jgi:glycosyltransferase involved in cell wall biosynthesis
MDKTDGFELVLVDNGSSDNTEQVIKDFAAQADFAVKQVSEPIAGLGQARETGWRAAAGDVISFTDDDCYVARDYATQLEKALAAEPDVGFFGGRIELFDPTDLPITILLGDHVYRIRPYKFVRPGAIQGANFGVRRSAIENAGGYDTRLGAGTRFPAEDIELVGRIAALGGSGIYFPKVIVAHHHGRKLKSEKAKLFKGYDWGAGAYYALMWRYKHMRLRLLWAWFMRTIKRHPKRWLREFKAFREFNRTYPEG